MLAAQCNKITNKSPPVLAEAPGGKSFMPWKKHFHSAPSPGPVHPHISSQRVASINHPHLQMSGNLSYPRSTVVSTNPHSSYPNDLFYSGASSNPHSAPQTADLSQTALLHKMHGDNGIGNPGFGSVYSRVPSMSGTYDPAWPFSNIPTTHPSATQGFKHNEMAHTVNGAGTPWWEVHPAANVHSTGSSWLSDSSALHGQIAASYPGPDYHIGHPLATTPSILTSQPQILQDTYKSMLQPSQPDITLSNSPVSPFLPRASIPGLPNPKNSRRYTGRATCDCPNCHEIDRLGKYFNHFWTFILRIQFSLFKWQILSLPF